MANVIPQKVAIVPNLATFQSSPVSGYQGSTCQLAYLQGEVTELDGGQGFYQARDNDYSTAVSYPDIIADSTGLRWQVTTAVTQAQIVSALTDGGTEPGLDPLSAVSANIAAATTTDLSTATGNYVNITGSGATITGLGTLTAGPYRFCVFAGANTLTNNATSLILPGGANITTAAGDFALFVSLGSGNWKCLVYQEAAGGTPGTLPVSEGGTGLTSGTSGGVLGFTASGTLASSVALTQNALVLGGGAGATPAPMASLGTTTTVLHGNAAGAPTFGAVSLTADVSGILPVANGGTNAATTVAGFDSLTTQGADVPAVAGVTDIGAATGPYVNVTGAETITGLGTVAAGTERIVKFTGACVLTHNGTSLILPGSADITTAANDTAAFVSLGSGNWLCLWYKLQSGLVLSSGIATASQSRDSTNTTSVLPPASFLNVGAGRVLFYLNNADMNSTADQTFTKNGTFTNWIMGNIFGFNSSTSLTTAVGGIYTGASKSGIPLLSASSVWTGFNGAGAGQALGATAGTNSSRQVLSATPILSLTTPQGATATIEWLAVIGYHWSLS